MHIDEELFKKNNNRMCKTHLEVTFLPNKTLPNGKIIRYEQNSEEIILHYGENTIEPLHIIFNQKTREFFNQNHAEIKVNQYPDRLVNLFSVK